MRSLYPEISQFHTYLLKTSGAHQVYVEQSGNPEGIPVLFLHGGPCSGTKPDHRRFFDPARYRIILFDQRGCGNSLPFGELEHNSTEELLADMEQIRQALQIEQWVLFGGSWGATLALLYAQQFTQRVSALIIRGVFLARQKDLDWFAKEGANRIYPEQWQSLRECAPDASAEEFVPALFAALWSNDEAKRNRVASEWLAWGGQVALGSLYTPAPTAEPVTEKMLKQVRMELHYAVHRYFMDENQILAHCKLLQDIPTIIIHGRNDLVCPMEAAMRLHEALPHANYRVLPNAGHIAQGEEMIDALVAATDCIAERLSSHFNALP